ncbi:hypothetical protein V1T75_02460 [Tenacibaculum sp. FZY0031]|uniref:hypothetical protein n=1 Tax=Tenacibaculum sp. FZY0031 TaxID=3116648 RepID=UPI002EC91B99|nr:hypothetical protein [Tenacibaculum sp. FZY0031]
MMKKLLLVIIASMMISCNVLPKKKTLHLASSPIELGVIGEQKRSIQKTAYRVFGIPRYKTRIKVAAVIQSFDKTTYNRYIKSIQQTSNANTITYIDSIAEKPKFIELQIMDKVGVISALNNENPEVYKYIKSNYTSSLVSKVRVVVTPSNLEKIRKTNAFYLQTLNNKEQYLMLYQNGKLIDKLNLYGMVTFGYDLSSFCWELTDRKKLKIGALLDEGENCNENTNRNPNKLLEQLTESSFKF